jgi:hypothetical protein
VGSIVAVLFAEFGTSLLIAAFWLAIVMRSRVGRSSTVA